jgi:branched-chain amino acid transport system ATP-binding protein
LWEDVLTEWAIETLGLTKSFGGFLAVNSVDLKVRQGSMHALIGPNGAGKTTVFNLLTKFYFPTSGRILINGEDVTGLKPAAISRRGVARSFQISSVFPHLTAYENVRVALQRKLGTEYRFWQSKRHLSVLDERVGELLSEVQLTDYAQRKAADLPYGRKRALEIATTLALDPEILLLDEPMAGMGSEDIERVIALIRKAAHGRTVVMVEHNLRVVADLCDTVTVLQRGLTLCEGSYAEVSSNPAVIEAYMGTEHA